MCSREEDERLVEVEGGAQKYREENEQAEIAAEFGFARVSGGMMSCVHSHI
jgi:hypothetical protein